MSSDLDESFLSQDTFRQSQKYPQQQGRARLTLLADLPEPSQNNMNNDVDSPVRTYLRNLQEERIQMQKQNLIGHGNRGDPKAEKQWKDQIRTSFQGQKKKTVHYDLYEARDNNSLLTKSQHIVQEHNTREKEHSRPGIYLYKKTINLADPPETWLNFGESYLRTSCESKSVYPMSSNKSTRDNGQDGLFSKAISQNKKSRRHH